MTSKCRLGISLKITFLKILVRATTAPAQWDFKGGERLPVGKQANFYIKMRRVELNYVNYDSVCYRYQIVRS